MPKRGNEDLIAAIRGTNCGLAKKLADAMIARASLMIGNDMTCSQHRGQPIVAFDQESNSFGCQQCIFETEGFEESEFITLLARDIYDTFKDNYVKFQEVQVLLSQVQPQIVTQNIRIRVSKLFEQLKNQLDSVEVEVMDQIKRSETLQLFLESSERLQEEVNDNLIDYIEEEHDTVSDKI